MPESPRQRRLVLPPMARRLMMGQSLSKTGDTFTQVALAIFVLKISRNNPAALGLVMAMIYAPRLVMGWAAMGWIDRWNKRRLLLIADGARALLVLSIALVHTFTWTAAAVFLIYVFQMLYHPAVRSIQPQLAGSVEANRVSVVRQDQWSQAGSIVAYIIGGFLIVHYGPSVGFVLDAVSYVISGAFILSLPVGLSLWQGGADQNSPYLTQIREGLQYAGTHRLVILLILISFFAMMGAAGSGTLLAPAMRRLWHEPTADYSWTLLALSVGAMVGSRLLETHGQGIDLRTLLMGGFFLTGIAIAGLTLVTSHLWLIMLIVAIVGLGNAMFSTSVMVWLQQILPIQVRGRVMTIRSSMMGLAGVIGSCGVGAVIAHAMSLGFVIVAALLIVSGLILLVPWFFRQTAGSGVSASI